MKGDTIRFTTTMALVVLNAILLLAVTALEIDCPDPQRFPGIALTETELDDKVELELDDTDELIFIRKSNDCYYSVYDRTLNTVTVTSKHDSYRSFYSFETQTTTESAWLSDWLEWERETRVGKAPHYSTKSELVDYYVPGSILALYVFVAVLSLIILLFVKLCCKTNRVQFY